MSELVHIKESLKKIRQEIMNLESRILMAENGATPQVTAATEQAPVNPVPPIQTAPKRPPVPNFPTVTPTMPDNTPFLKLTELWLDSAKDLNVLSPQAFVPDSPVKSGLADFFKSQAKPEQFWVNNEVSVDAADTIFQQLNDPIFDYLMHTHSQFIIMQ